MATADQVPFSSGHLIVWLPDPDACTRQKPWAAGRGRPRGPADEVGRDPEGIRVEVGDHRVLHAREIALDVARAGDPDEDGLR